MIDEEGVVDKIAGWVYARHLHTATPASQYMKFQEEAGEIAADLCRGRDPTDSLGDTFVTLISLCLCLNINPFDAMEVAYDEIKDRKGRLINGVFVKEADLPENKLIQN